MRLYVNLKHILFLGCIFFCMKAFTNEQCGKITLEHIQPSSTISLLTFTYQENDEKKHEYIFIDGDGAASLLTILHILQTTPQKPISNIMRRFINHQASLLKDVYKSNIDHLVQRGALYAEQILGDRIIIIDRLLEALRNGNNDILSDIIDDLFTHLSQNHYQHQYEVHYHSDYNQETQGYASSQSLKGVPIINSRFSSNMNNIVSYHFFNRCPIEVDLEHLASHLHL